MIENGELTGEKNDQLCGETDEGGNSYGIIADHMANSEWWVGGATTSSSSGHSGSSLTGETSALTLGF